MMPARRRTFTLLELLVVITLTTIAVSIVAFRMDGLTDRGRLQSAAAQLASWVHLTRTQAATAGVPRLIIYRLGREGLTVRNPRYDADAWRWDDGLECALDAGVTVRRVVVEGREDSDDEADRCAIRIGPDGRYRAHAILLARHDQCAVVLLRSGEPPEYLFPERNPSATSFDLLTLELEQHRHAG